MKDILHYTTSFLNIRIISFILAFISYNHCYGFFKSIPDSPPSKTGYLSFQAPPKLQFHETDVVADRRKLLRHNSKPAQTTLAPITVQDDKEPSFPLVSYGDQNVSSPVYLIPSEEVNPGLVNEQLLPPNDPFVNEAQVQPNLNNTDELIEILESGVDSSKGRMSTNINFVPPYTMDGGNLILESKSRYTRRTSR